MQLNAGSGDEDEDHPMTMMVVMVMMAMAMAMAIARAMVVVTVLLVMTKRRRISVANMQWCRSSAKCMMTSLTMSHCDDDNDRRELANADMLQLLPLPLVISSSTLLPTVAAVTSRMPLPLCNADDTNVHV